MNIEALIII